MIFKNLLKTLNDYAQQRSELRDQKITSFNDPIAKEIPWTPTDKNGGLFGKNRLVSKPNGDLVIKPTYSTHIGLALFCLMGMYIVVLALRPPISFNQFVEHPLDSLFGLVTYTAMQVQLSHLNTGSLLGLLFGAVFFCGWRYTLVPK